MGPGLNDRGTADRLIHPIRLTARRLTADRFDRRKSHPPSSSFHGVQSVSPVAAPSSTTHPTIDIDRSRGMPSRYSLPSITPPPIAFNPRCTSRVIGAAHTFLRLNILHTTNFLTRAEKVENRSKRDLSVQGHRSGVSEGAAI
uniref:Uncharacterized protein n=1 Tax=Plectus sambesii TaxID=2011161 RepID=A0A914WZC9_9BILA